MKIIKRLLLVAAVLAVAACDLAETNVDPTRLQDTELNLALPEGISSTVYNQSANPARVSGIITQQFIGFDAQQLQYTEYVIESNTFNNYWNFGLYSGALKSLDVIVEKAQAEGNSYYDGIAKILMAENFGQGTLMFGDMPFSEALQGQEILRPTYDTQEQVLNGVIAMLDEAIGLLSNPTGLPPTSDDLIYGGDAEGWIKTAQALKARYLMQTSKRNPGNAAQALTAIAASYTSLAEQSDFAYDNNQIGNNPLAKFGIERTNTLIIDDRFADAMTERQDPRQPRYMAFNGSEWQYFDGGNPDLVWAQNNSVIPLISYVELKFLEAEALAQTGASTGEIQAALAEGIRASIEQVGLDPAEHEDFIAAQSDLSGLSGDAVIQRIIEEAYYSYYGFGFIQVWNNYRRTGFPELTPSPNGVNGLNPSGVIPRRYIYPLDEQTTNRENWQAARDRQNGALLDVDVWAFE